jgi:glucose repression regulatory protein TUP1
MAGSAAQGGPGLAPPPQEQQGQPGMPGHMQAPGAPGFNAPPAPPHNPFAYGGQPQGPGVNGYGPQPPQPTASPGPGKPYVGAGGRVDGLATPQQSQPNPYPGSPSVARPTPPPAHQAPPPQQNMHEGFQYAAAELDEIGNKLSDLDPNKLSPALKRSGEDWHAVFNPRVMRRLDVDLVHNLVHQSVVCCVRFSADGKYVATGCNRSAQIFDVVTGQQVCHLTDNTTNQDGDLYIRSVCFSPNGKFLATGAEDKIIRVSWTCTWYSTSLTNMISGLGHCQQAHPPPVRRPRAGYLLSRLRLRRSSHRLRLRRPHNQTLGYPREPVHPYSPN